MTTENNQEKQPTISIEKEMQKSYLDYAAPFLWIWSVVFLGYFP